ncbi:protein PF3D7_1417600-like [Condylostylus longicornis]|uniref:protein PF3D7_1417600-like n=1 Tax=Condylostylus longicornis TaxID=2530218 RepID=UPI00244DACE3|nr:protein PF3D7_1417600-like [Condylostylus longicornis]XP_055372414.1 protein PF3D7_1417600-like [Condylostylus longicornis]XP_055372415.1 protein PF3D7_1417600-like [Condylostylus longicornis]XP_055372416.1 protein PF3D7_1417600-like [Condylostylus longicornis]XP_055372417.1 protein PF3D7_1417600-like [Condylostylus longicornis]XP_055372418.1 protein PF3D7_1417600-like [Condylostylus longicornis]XP_055372419.1 protein PF3D7_1417600-like [Condylostylus longicornis]
MVNKQYKIQHNLDNNYINSKTSRRTNINNYRIPLSFNENIPIQNFPTVSNTTTGSKLSILSSSDNTPSFTSYESIDTNKSVGEDFVISEPKLKQQNQFFNNFHKKNLNCSEEIYRNNIKMSYNDGTGNDGTTRKNPKYSRNYYNQQSNQYDNKDLTINDIGRFQYILQMDKELGTYPESYYHLSSQSHQNNGLPTNGSDMKSISLNSSNIQNPINFWKAGSTDYPMKSTTTTTTTTSASSSISSKPLHFRNRASKMYHWHKHNLLENSRTFWGYAKWPILLLLLCLVLCCVIFLLFIMNTNISKNFNSKTESSNDNIMSANFSDETISLTDFNGNLQVIETDYNINNNEKSIYINNNNNINNKGNNNDNNKNLKEILTIYMKSPDNSTTITKSNESINIKSSSQNFSKTGISLQEIDFELDNIKNDNKKNNNNNKIFDEKIKIMKNTGSTTKNPLLHRNTQIMKFSTVKGFKPEDDILIQSSTENNKKYLDSNEKSILSSILPPTKETIHVIGFTSGHQNNFGVPIEEDERILKLLNDEIIKYESQENNSTTPIPDIQSSSSTTTVKVSPTLPLIIHHKDTSPSRFRTTTESLISNSSDVCESTSLPICQGILRYDLTTTKSKRILESMDLEHFKYLIASKCSNRAAEFICSVLEPECRSAKLGSLQPCKRICKAILEPCAGLISSSEMLTMTFDCDRYPDSSDRNVCEDPTRRSIKCYDNEYQCLDYTCIPKQWKCDNIKDCSLGEDEENCQFCHHDEFQCQSDSKCITEKWRCDGYNDCDDASDENNCDEYDEFNDEDSVDDDEINDDYNSKIYNLFTDQFQQTTLSNYSNGRANGLPFLAISIDDEDSNNENLKYGNNEGLFGKSIINNIESQVNLTTDKMLPSENEENEEIQTGEASGRIVVGVSQNQGLGNFKDSTEIMMTSDSQNDFKYSKVMRGNSRTRNSTVTTTTTTSSKRVSGSSSAGSTTRTSLRLTTLSRRGTPSTTTSTTTTTTPEPISTKLLRTSAQSRRTTSPTTTSKDPKDHSTLCPGAQLRCVSGKCINVDQLCDKVIDCPDGADEARCVYKDDEEN